MTPEEWLIYIDTGEVPFTFLKEMVDIIKEGKSLTDKHLAVYQTHSQIIEALLKK